MSETLRKMTGIPILSAGAAPPNHSRPYIPTHAEILQGARDVAKIQERIAAEQSKDLEKNLAEVFKNWEKK